MAAGNGGRKAAAKQTTTVSLQAGSAGASGQEQAARAGANLRRNAWRVREKRTVGSEAQGNLRRRSWLRDAGRQPSARRTGATPRFGGDGGKSLTARTACIRSEDTPSGGPRCDVAGTAARRTRGAQRAARAAGGAATLDSTERAPLRRSTAMCGAGHSRGGLVCAGGDGGWIGAGRSMARRRTGQRRSLTRTGRTQR